MTFGFWAIAIIMMAFTLMFLVPALRKKSTVIMDDRREQNISIAKQQLKELEVERKEGSIESDAYESAKSELEQALYDDLEGTKKQVAKDREKETRYGLIFTVLFVPALAIGMYQFTGQADALGESSVVHKDPKDLTPEEARTNISVMLEKLESKLEKEPNNLEGWLMLGRSYMVMDRDQDALKAYTKANELAPDSPETLLPLADILATIKKGDLKGKPEELVLKALEKEPNNIMALWLAGMAARQRGVNAEALQHWQKLEPMLDPASDDRKEVRAMIAQIGGQLAALPEATAPAPATTAAQPQQPANAPVENQPAPVVAAPAATAAPAPTAPPQGEPTSTTAAKTNGIKVTVSLSAALQDKVTPETTVFVYAKAIAGPPMPLAVLRKQVKDLPLTLILDDSMAMMPQLKISSFDAVKVEARVSFSGAPKAQAGDLFSEKSSVKIGDVVTLEIDSVVGEQAQAVPAQVAPPVAPVAPAPTANAAPAAPVETPAPPVATNPATPAPAAPQNAQPQPAPTPPVVTPTPAPAAPQNAQPQPAPTPPAVTPAPAAPQNAQPQPAPTPPAVTPTPAPAAPQNAQPQPAPVSSEGVSDGIKVTVSLADAFKAQVTPETTVFIYAKALSGPPMPLAVVRKQVKDLPLEVVLDKSMAMMPQLNISSFPAVKVEARVSLSGTPKAQSGDIFGEKSPVKVGDVVELVMGSVVE